MASFLAILMLLALAWLMSGFFKVVGRTVTGAYVQPADNRLEGDDPARGLIQEGVGNCAELTLSSFPDVKSQTCPIHEGRHYIGYTRFVVTAPVHGDLGRRVECHLSIVGCEACAVDAARLRSSFWRDGLASRENPPEFSAAVFPHLNTTRQFYMDSPFIAFDMPPSMALAETWLASSDPDDRLNGVLALEYRKCDQAIGLLKSCLGDRAKSKRDPIHRKPGAVAKQFLRT